VVGEMIFGATDTINIYLPDAALNQGSVVASNTATLDQTAFDTVTFATKGDGAYAVDEIRFGTTYADVVPGAVVPGPDPRITSFASVGAGLWELTLSGEPDTGYEFYSSTTLDFTPGTLVENLTQGAPGDAGTIGGTNDSVLTTDASGDGKVRVILTGDPADFLRAQSVP
ncbi:hypothetical protein, partial [Haloferula sp. A504]|uniref:hypothetical protein n=1 Tax=Haloferula sp. A504 TaxID=3373601 RepID=UPI0031BE0DEC|nr:hypothetical protein [Verrucomicrobiaceae bacterium E54]